MPYTTALQQKVIHYCNIVKYYSQHWLSERHAREDGANTAQEYWTELLLPLLLTVKYTYKYARVTPPTRVRTNSPSGSRTRDSDAGGGHSNKERQRLQPLASVARAPLLRSGEWGLHTALTGIHPLHSPP